MVDEPQEPRQQITIDLDKAKVTKPPLTREQKIEKYSGAVSEYLGGRIFEAELKTKTSGHIFTGKDAADNLRTLNSAYGTHLDKKLPQPDDAVSKKQFIQLVRDLITAADGNIQTTDFLPDERFNKLLQNISERGYEAVRPKEVKTPGNASIAPVNPTALINTGKSTPYLA